MPLPTPKKGTAPATGQVKPPAAPKPSRAEQLMSATRALAAEQLPEEHTMTAIEGAAAATVPADASRSAPPVADREVPPPTPGGDAASAGPRTTTPASAGDGAMIVRRVRVAEIRSSPFQPRGRPSAVAVQAVRAAVEEAGSLEALAAPEGARLFARLDAEAARLAELAYDIAAHGVKTPLELRTAEDGADECLAGHRRLAAAQLAGLEHVPAIHHGPMPNARAAATVLRGNLHRENFTTWQEAVLVTEVQDRRRADGHRDTVRTLGAVMGWSHGKVNMLLRIRRALAPALLAQAGDGDAARAEEALARAAYRDLERLANEGDERRRAGAVRRLLGLAPAGGDAAARPADRPAYTHRPKRGGGFVVEVHEPVEALAAGDAALVYEVLAGQLARVRTRLEQLGHPTPSATPPRTRPRSGEAATGA